MPFNVAQAQVLTSFGRLGVRYLVVGGHAMRAYGLGRQTHDLDLWVARDVANARALMRFARTVPAPPTLDRLQQPNFKITVGDPRRPDVDILTSVAGDPDFDELFARRLRQALDGHRLDFVSLQDLVVIKEAAAAKQKADAASGEFNAAERLAAARTAEKERRDVGLLKMWAAAGGAGPAK